MMNLQALSAQLKGDFYSDNLHRILYATDASIYREIPLAVAYPKDAKDIQTLVKFAAINKISLIPRTAGTSLAGQCVGPGIVVDVSRYMNKILEVNVEEAWVRVQPGVIRDELNVFLKPYGVFFGPITATATRAMIGGMVGNNSSGTTSIKYGVTRDHVMELHTILSDGSNTVFKSLLANEFQEKLNGNSLECKVYRQIYKELSNPEIQEEIRKEFPKPSIHRRSTGYAVDELLKSNIFTLGGPDFNFCKLLTGSEGTLAFTTEIKLHLNPLPPPEEATVCAHFATLSESLEATLVAMRHQPYACELMDKFTLDCTKENIALQKNRFFLQGDPEAILIIEFRGETREEATALAEAMIADMNITGFGYAFPIVYPPDAKKVMALRAAGFGVLSNVKTDTKPIEFVEDTAVDLPDLPAYIEEFRNLMTEFGQQAVYYAHAGAGELHIRPSVNLKTSEGVRQMHAIAEASAKLVKKYNGSLSGEHGDGRVRGEFIPLMLGNKNFELLKRVKETWDPYHVFNPNKITGAPPMDQDLRYVQDVPKPAFDTVFDFSETGGILRTTEKCGGSGDCRKLAHVTGGVMCPSYMATRNEKDTTRARANTLREFLTRSENGENRFAHEELKNVMDLCLSCKGCTSECPSNVDMSTLKAEFLHQYYKAKGIPLRAKAFANIGKLNGLAANISGISNFFLTNSITSNIIKQILGVAPKRSLPELSNITLRKWYNKYYRRLPIEATRKVYFFCDEYTNYNDAHIGIKAIELLTKLGYDVIMPTHAESGRAHISKGLLLEAQKMAKQNVDIFKDLVNENNPLIGIEPSAILSFRDEYYKLVDKENQAAAKELGKNALLIEEFIAREIQKGNITSELFTSASKQILLHGHCHQKALSSVDASAWTLGLPENYVVEVIPSGCCGMAGSFGYEKEHYDVSMQIGELILFPAIKKVNNDVIIAAPGTSCRHQILDGTGRKALHPVEVLWEALMETK
ncbi:MAG: FAD-linked oxidase C-terminal domain-containing protein [Saprospiraceae bacterium]|nr:FAD-linked oxidase C-terminal domain-containing protein [Saprospiraceae bacterium]